ncbi:hypothetical protein [Leptothermofonsia sp. ETS-13]|uniref:hypothetical protein n=1 Tax=Leptothermofonsia sp. ETS-13 TaxID=3035696 RepID=UPI003B9E9BCA
MPAFKPGLGIWEGKYEGVTRFWLRWSDSTGNWILTLVEDDKRRLSPEQNQYSRDLFEMKE